jgi:hypothetical protein
VSYWIATVILAQDSDESRASTLSFFIEVAKSLRQLNNFHTLMGVVAGLFCFFFKKKKKKKKKNVFF